MFALRQKSLVDGLLFKLEAGVRVVEPNTPLSSLLITAVMVISGVGFF